MLSEKFKINARRRVFQVNFKKINQVNGRLRVGQYRVDNCGTLQTWFKTPLLNCLEPFANRANCGGTIHELFQASEYCVCSLAAQTRLDDTTRSLAKKSKRHKGEDGRLLLYGQTRWYFSEIGVEREVDDVVSGLELSGQPPSMEEIGMALVISDGKSGESCWTILLHHQCQQT